MKNFINLQLIPQKHINNPFNITKMPNQPKMFLNYPLSVLKWNSMIWLKDMDIVFGPRVNMQSSQQKRKIGSKGLAKGKHKAQGRLFGFVA